MTYEAKIAFLTFLEDVVSEKIPINLFETHRVLILEVVADHQYHSSRPSSQAAKISHNQKVIAAAKMAYIAVFRCRKVKNTL